MQIVITYTQAYIKFSASPKNCAFWHTHNVVAGLVSNDILVRNYIILWKKVLVDFLSFSS